MAKTQHVDKDPGIGQEGTPVTAAIMNSLYYTGGGHKHDGGAEDGSAAKVDLTAHVTGQLPSANVFQTGIKMAFNMAAAPTGWTQDTANTDAALRVVSGAGGGTGGTHGVSGPPSAAHTHTTASHVLTVSELPSHFHGGGAHNYIFDGTDGIAQTIALSGSSYRAVAPSATAVGDSTAHAHGATGSGGPTAFAPKYVDVIICTKN